MAKKKIYRARESFVGNDGFSVARGDLALEGADRPGGKELWEEVDESAYIRFFPRSEQATAAPGEERPIHVEPEGDEPAAVEDLESLTVAELKEVARSRGVTPGTLNKQELVEAIRLRG